MTGEASSPLIDAAATVTLLGNMHGGYNVATLVNLLDVEALAEAAAEELKVQFWCLMRSTTWQRKPMQERPCQGRDAVLGGC